MSVPESQPQQYPEPPEPLRVVHRDGERIIPLDVGFALVASKSEPDVWHVVEHGHCTCAAFRYRETCRHLALAAQATASVAPEPQAPGMTDAEAERLFAKLDMRHSELLTLADD